MKQSINKSHRHLKFSMKIIKLLISLGFCILLYRCERVIEVDLNDASPALVIEANLSYIDKYVDVRISRTGSYFSDDNLDVISGAKVILKNDSGDKYIINESEPGIYREDIAILRTGEEYSLSVEVNEIVYSAVSIIHPVVNIDSLSYSYSKGAMFYDDGYRVHLYFQDPEEMNNYYRIRTFKNGELQNDIDNLIVFEDSRINGKMMQVKLRSQNFDKGDTAYIEFLSIDEGAWRYFTTLQEVADANPGSPAPANPKSNFDNGALGYFSAWSHDYMSVVIDN